MRLCKSLLGSSLLALLASSAVSAHEGRLDANGCHYDRGNGNRYHCHKEVPPNPERNATVKKSRENICHDAGSPNYSKLQYFVSYKSMKQCTSSGGRPYKH